MVTSTEISLLGYTYYTDGYVETIWLATILLSLLIGVWWRFYNKLEIRRDEKFKAKMVSNASRVIASSYAANESYVSNRVYVTDALKAVAFVISAFIIIGLSVLLVPYLISL